MKKHCVLISIAVLGMSGIVLLSDVNNNPESTAEAKESENNAVSTATMSQDEIKNKMINSIDYFDSAKGEFTYSSIPAGFNYSVSYEVSNVDGNYASHVITTNNITGDIREDYYDGANFATLYHTEKMYNEGTLTPDDADTAEDLYTYEKRKAVTSEGVPVTYHREDPTQMGMASNSLFPQVFAFGYLEDNNLWNITGYEDYLGREVVVIEGYPGDYMSYKIQSNSFKMWIDTETGIMLKYEAYDANGEVTERLETTSIVLDDPSINELNYSYAIPEGYSSIR